jgi:hypothetical protein
VTRPVVLGFPNWAGDPTRQVEHLFKTAHQAEFWILDCRNLAMLTSCTSTQKILANYDLRLI